MVFNISHFSLLKKYIIFKPCTTMQGTTHIVQVHKIAPYFRVLLYKGGENLEK